MLCDRCGERYNPDDKHATNDYCGTCVFINGPRPNDRFVAHPYAANEKKARREEPPPESTPEVDSVEPVAEAV
jgi:hypothetical protein